jgi:hypothetical protein
MRGCVPSYNHVAGSGQVLKRAEGHFAGDWLVTRKHKQPVSQMR